MTKNENEPSEEELEAFRKVLDTITKRTLVEASPLQVAIITLGAEVARALVEGYRPGPLAAGPMSQLSKMGDMPDASDEAGLRKMLAISSIAHASMAMERDLTDRKTPGEMSDFMKKVLSDKWEELK